MSAPYQYRALFQWTPITNPRYENFIYAGVILQPNGKALTPGYYYRTLIFMHVQYMIYFLSIHTILYVYSFMVKQI